jgi:hypothetical protein
MLTLAGYYWYRASTTTVKAPEPGRRWLADCARSQVGEPGIRAELQVGFSSGAAEGGTATTREKEAPPTFFDVIK